VVGVLEAPEVLEVPVIMAVLVAQEIRGMLGIRVPPLILLR